MLTAPHDLGQAITRLALSLLDPNLEETDLGLRADQLVFGIERRPGTFADVTSTSPTVPTFPADTEFRCKNAARMKFQYTYRKYTTSVPALYGNARRQPSYVALVREAFDATHPKSVSWLVHQCQDAPASEVGFSKRFLEYCRGLCG